MQKSVTDITQYYMNVKAGKKESVLALIDYQKAFKRVLQIG